LKTLLMLEFTMSEEAYEVTCKRIQKFLAAKFIGLSEAGNVSSASEALIPYQKQEDLAREAFTHRKNIAREMSDLRKLNLVDPRFPHSIWIDVEGLRRFIDDL